MEISSRYNPAETEDKWYKHWERKGYFHSEPDGREPFSIVIPPPNVTGVLHMGHMLNNTIQDILIRKAKLEGKNACWVPGMDHASIATEAKVVRMLREKGIKKSDLTREKFLEYAWEWKEKYGGIILQQLRKLGASCDWERTAFTMDEERSNSVIKVFIDLYKKGKLYRGLRMVNWDPEAKTVLSNEEVIYKDEQSHIYYLRYLIEGTKDKYLTIATTRPETILGDTAIAVHPDDERYAHLKGKRVLVPLINRSIPVIFDNYVEREFGTGALKITPAHDVNDYEIGQRHNLEVIDILNDDGSLNEKAEHKEYFGLDRFAARKKIIQELEENGYLFKKEDYLHNVGRSERTNAVVEPKLSLQWYVDMKSIVQPALEAVVSDDVEFFPKNQKNLYKHWMENIRDWCISRQLWWGHRIPAYYIENEVFVAETAEEALAQAQAKFNDPSIELSELKQDEDVLDTWFSSWLWPISVFNGFSSREDVDYYYPTSVLVTGWDIIFLWVARMIMAGFEWRNERPFKEVYFTGMVRDKQRRKMSKQLGNSPDALKLIEEYGADGVRYGMLSSSPAGGDLLFEEKLCEQGRNFSNKIWNALRLVKGWKIDEKIDTPQTNKLAIEWFKERMKAVVKENEDNYKQYRLSESLVNTYIFIWNDFCSWLLEMVKPNYGDPIDAYTQKEIIHLFEQICVLLHPYMPFITEEIWHLLKDRVDGDDCMVAKWPEVQDYDSDIIKSIDKAKDLISKIRDTRNKNGVKAKEKLHLYIEKSKSAEELYRIDGMIDLVKKLAVLDSLDWYTEEHAASISILSGTEKYHLELNQEVDKDAEKERLLKELDYAKGFLMSVEKKLSNDRFVNNAPEQVVAKERKKLEDGKERIRILEENLAAL